MPHPSIVYLCVPLAAIAKMNNSISLEQNSHLLIWSPMLVDGHA
jgi:hypothetical protein